MALSIKAEERKLLGRQSKQLRQKGYLPAVIYGHGVESRAIKVEQLSFAKLLKEAGYSNLVDLEMAGQEPVKVLIQDVQREPVSSQLIHADFFQVNLKEKLETTIPLKFTGEALAVKIYNAVLVTNIDEIKVRCLPQDLVSEIAVDLSALAKMEDVILVRDLSVPTNIEVRENPDEAVVVLTKIEEEAEVPAATEQEAIAQIETSEKKGKEEEGEPKEEKKGEAAK